MNGSLNILFEDNSIIVINKPAGLATQSANISQRDCVSLLKEHLKRENPDKKGEPYVGVIHRLDQPVSGILVFAKNPKSAALLSKQVQSDFMNKHYNAVVEGQVSEGKLSLNSLLYKDSKNSKAIVVNERENAPQGVKIQEAKLEYSVISYNTEENTTLVDIHLITGRFHQIRAQFASIGHPIVGDKKYGSTKICKGIALEAISLDFVHPETREKMSFTIQ